MAPIELTPVNLKPSYMGAPPATPVAYNPNYRLDHFATYRNERISRMPPFHYEWGGMVSVYTPLPDKSVYKSTNKYLHIPETKVSMVDRGRQREVDDFYVACQHHRDQYKDDTGVLHPLDYFKKSEYMYQCPKDPTNRYMTYPEYFVKYKHPIVLPVTKERTVKYESMPDRALTGVFSPHSDNVWKRTL